MSADTRPGVQRLTADEAVAALTAAAWTERISEERYEAAVEAALSLTRDADGEPLADGTQIPAAEVARVIREALGEPRVGIHCMMGSLGTDRDLAGAIEIARRDGARCAWAPNMFRHELAVFADGKMYRFDARRPAEQES